MDARSLLALANLKKQSRYLSDRARIEVAKKEDWRWVGFDSTIGMGVVRSGNVTKRGKVITNGYLVPGQPIEFNEDGQFATIEGMPYIKPNPRRNPQFVPREPTTPSIAILFEANKDGGALGLYIGGLTPEPIEVAAPGSGFPTYETPAGYRMDNTGEGTYKIMFSTGVNIGILGQWTIPNADQKISPATTRPEDVIDTQIYTGSGIFVGRSDYMPVRDSLPFYFGPGPYTIGQSATATWTAGVRVDAPALIHQTTVSAIGTYVQGSIALLQTVGSGFYVLPDGTLEPISIDRTLSGTTYRSVQVMFCESVSTFVYKVETYSGPLSTDSVGSIANPIVTEYYYYNGGTRTKVAESSTVGAGGTPAVISGNPIEIDFASRLNGRLVGTTIYTPLTDFFGQSGQPSDHMAGTYEVQEIDLFGAVTQKTYSVNPIPANYVIPPYALGGSRIWNASFNFEI